MYNRRSYFRGGRVNYGLGGALLKVGSNLAQGKGFGSGALQGVGKAAITPGSAIGAGAELAGGLLQKSDNPLAQKIGKGLDVASNFAPGGGGIKGAVGDVAGMIGQNQAAGAGPGAAGAAGASGGAAGTIGNIAQNFLGQAHGGKVKLIKAQEGMSIPGYAADPSLGFAAGTMGRRTSGGGRPEELMDFASFYKRQTGEDMPGIGSFPENYNQGSSDRNLDPSLYYPGFDQEAMDKANQMYAMVGNAGQDTVDFDARDPDAYPTSGRMDGRPTFHPKYQGFENARKATQVYDRMKEQEAAYHDYMKSWSPVDAQKKPEYSFEEGEGGEGGTLKITNAQRQSNGGMVYAQGGTNIPKDPKAAGSPAADNRSWMQMLADEVGQIGSGISGMAGAFDPFDQSPRGGTGPIGAMRLFQKYYDEQEAQDRAREESGQKGRVDAFGRAIGAFDRALEGQAPTKIGGEEWSGPTNPFDAAVNAYERARTTEAARNATRQFAGGRVRLMKR